MIVKVKRKTAERNGLYENCCTDSTNFCGLDDCTEINMRGCDSDREDWRSDGFDPELIM